jgi:hypothetical protein
MASRAEHCRESIEKFGKPYEEVHAWLDGLACVDGKLNINHRRWRHHVEALAEVRRLFGDDAVAVAEQHIRTDFAGELPTRQQVEDAFPEEPELMSWDLLG